MKRNPRKLKWTKAFRKAAGKEMLVDSTLAFAARRNIPTRYDRNLVATTLKAMQRVTEIRARRERAFYRSRMAGNKERQREADRKLVEENQHLLPPKERTVVVEEQAEVGVVQKVEMKEDMVVDEEVVEERLRVKVKVPKAKRKQRLIVGQGPEGMDVDS